MIVERMDAIQEIGGGRDGVAAEGSYAALLRRVSVAAAGGGYPLGRYAYQWEPCWVNGAAGDAAFDLLVVRAGPTSVDAAARHVLLVGGVHGDEPAGVEAVVRFLEERRDRRWPGVAFTVLPCLNPWGFAHGRREGPGEADLNRSFRRATAATRELSALKRVLRRRPFDLLVDCHEDCDAPGLYAVAAPAALGVTVVQAARHVGPLHQGADVDGLLPLAGGVVDVDAPDFRALRLQAKAWALPMYVAAYQQRYAPEAAQWRAGLDEPPLVPPTVVIETPTRLPLEQRVAMHLAAIAAAVGTLT